MNVTRSDCGSNVVGAINELRSGHDVDGHAVVKVSSEHGFKWVLNPPDSHYDGAWERMIGVRRKTLDYLLMTQ